MLAQANVLPQMALRLVQGNWRKDVLRQLESRLGERTFVYFKYLYHKLFDLRARDFFDE